MNGSGISRDREPIALRKTKLFCGLLSDNTSQMLLSLLLFLSVPFSVEGKNVMHLFYLWPFANKQNNLTSTN